MKISTRGRYALRVMIDLAQHMDQDYVPMKEVAQRQEISLKYLERIMPSLTKNNFVQGVIGQKGGYKLVRLPKEYTVKEILEVAEGSLALIACLECDQNPCSRKDTCKTLPMWKGAQKVIESYFDGITLQDLLDGTFD
ncbi:RrF2 family transcriptional regulator [Floccifex sp.]|uniref:RrF2 family transcriptional regulator n=1 Tax=Floccifex sp. TaxID=2815810 RepID=UPI002A7654DB|nr:Rrf2 family transcriptional regulator [Floccifex sp.]MDD7282273.1 Rrf2 family transcriptional regulator [Erysipelotrichaceae bacterium]MDY2958221.1 Rrf2 family transcriptional regulator [Floccifex sp.]